MVFKNISQAIEDTIFVEAESLWIDGLDINKIKDLPGELLYEMKSFVERNSLAIIAYKIEGKMPLHCCCLRCLKAHLMKKCKELGLEGHKDSISEIFNCETGHGGYYVDSSELFKT